MIEIRSTACMTYLGECERFNLGFMNCIILARRALSDSSSSGVMAAAFRFNDVGMVGVETLRV